MRDWNGWYKWWNKRSETQKTLLTIALLFFGLLLALFGMHEIRIKESSKDWPTVKGQITRSIVLHDVDNYYEARISYSYSVNGRVYSSSRVTAGSLSSLSARSAQEIVNRYPQGATVVVYYNPNSPSEAVLEPGHSLGACPPEWTLLLGGVIVIRCLIDLLRRMR